MEFAKLSDEEQTKYNIEYKQLKHDYVCYKRQVRAFMKQQVTELSGRANTSIKNKKSIDQIIAELRTHN